MGVADRHGKHKSNDCNSRGQCCSIPGQAKPVFLPFLLVQSPLQFAKVPEGSDQAVFMLATTTTTTDGQPIILPFVHAHGVIMRTQY